EVLEAEGMLAAVGNTRCYGGGMKVCPGARYDDGLLEVVFVHAVAAADFVRFFPRVFSGTHTELDEVAVVRGRRVTITTDGWAAGIRAVGCCAEGVGFGESPLTGEIAPKSVRVLRWPLCAPPTPSRRGAETRARGGAEPGGRPDAIGWRR